MILALRAFGTAFGRVSSHLTFSVVASVIASLLSIPLLALAALAAITTGIVALLPLGAALAIGILPCPATAGVQVLAYNLVRNEIVTIRDIWPAWPQYWKPALRLWLVDVVVTAFVLGNLAFYAGPAGDRGFFLRPVAAPLTVIWLVILLWWLAVQLYLYPLLLAQETPDLRLIFRNAAVIALTRPLFSLSVTLIWLAVLLVCSVSAVAVLIGLALTAAIQQSALLRILPKFHHTST